MNKNKNKIEDDWVLKVNNTLNPNTTSDVEFHKRNNTIIITLISQEHPSIITERIKEN